MFVKKLRILADDLINSYEMRVKTVGSLMHQTAKLLQDRWLEQERLIGQLRQNLAKNQSLRKKDFDSMMAWIYNRQEEQKKEIEERLERFYAEEKGFIGSLRLTLAKGGSEGSFSLKDIYQDIFSRQRKRENEIACLIRNFHIEQEELRCLLRRLLKKGETAKIKDFKGLLREMQNWYHLREAEIGDFLESLRVIQQEVTGKWQKLFLNVNETAKEKV